MNFKLLLKKSSFCNGPYAQKMPILLASGEIFRQQSIKKSGVGGENMTSPTAQVEDPKTRVAVKLLVGGGYSLGLLMVGVVLFSHRGLYQITVFRHDQVRLDQEKCPTCGEKTLA